VATIENKKGSLNEVVLSRLDDITRQISEIRTSQRVRIPERTESESDKEEIKKLTRKLIEQYCADNKIQESELYEANETDEIKRKLYGYIEGNRDMRGLCGSPYRISKAISDNLYPF
jgi:hypothetical protein